MPEEAPAINARLPVKLKDGVVGKIMTAPDLMKSPTKNGLC